MAHADSVHAHAWAHGNDVPKGYTSIKYYRKGDDTIYSYGTHFPIAKHWKGKVLFTLHTNSVTTSGHISAVRSAVSHLQKIYCYDFPNSEKDASAHEHNIKQWLSQIQNNLTSLITARKKSKYTYAIDHIKELVNVYVTEFKIKLTTKQKKLLNATDYSVFTDQIIKERKAAEKKKAADLKRGNELLPKVLEAWRTFKLFDFDRGSKNDVMLLTMEERNLADVANNTYLESIECNTRLRCNDEAVMTSKSIEVPIVVAKRYYQKYLAIVAKGGCEGNCNIKMLDFDVKFISADKLVVGCHSIPRSEINYIAQKLNW